MGNDLWAVKHIFGLVILRNNEDGLTPDVDVSLIMYVVCELDACHFGAASREAAGEVDENCQVFL